MIQVCKVHLDQLVLSVHPAISACRVPLDLTDCLEQQVLTALLETLVHQDLLVRLVYQEIRDGQASRGQWAQLELVVQWELLVVVVDQVLLEPRDPLEISAQLVTLELLERLDCLE